MQESAAAVAPVSVQPLTAAAGSESEDETPVVVVAHTENAPRSRWRFAAGVVAAAVLLGLGIWAVQHRGVQVPLQLGDKGLLSAVLPATVEPGPESDWMRLGIMDVVASRLRTSGLPSVPSESVVAFLNVAAADRSGTVREATAARWLVSPYVRHIDTRWQVDLNADDGAGQHFAVQGQARDAVEAGRDAADKLLVALGRQPAGATAEAPYEILVKRVDAAVLADNPDVARALIAQASVEAQQSPELRLRLAKLDFRAGRLDAARQRLSGLLDEAPAKTAPVYAPVCSTDSVRLPFDRTSRSGPSRRSARRSVCWNRVRNRRNWVKVVDALLVEPARLRVIGQSDAGMQSGLQLAVVR